MAALAAVNSATSMRCGSDRDPTKPHSWRHSAKDSTACGNSMPSGVAYSVFVARGPGLWHLTGSGSSRITALSWLCACQHRRHWVTSLAVMLAPGRGSRTRVPYAATASRRGSLGRLSSSWPRSLLPCWCPSASAPHTPLHAQPQGASIVHAYLGSGGTSETSLLRTTNADT